MAKENDKPDMEEMEETKFQPVKPSEGNKMEASEKNESASDNVTGKDIDDVLMILNEIDQISGGKGNIGGIPKELHGPVKFLIEKMITVRDAFADPLFKDVLDDMDDQRQEGKTPSLLVAVARNVPMEELMKIADDENYEDVQNAVNERVSKEKEDEESEKKLYGNFDKSKKAIEKYASSMGYDDARKQRLFARIARLRDVFADGLDTEEEAAEIDKIDNYDSDIESLKSSIPEGSVKTVLPDKASLEESMNQAPAPVKKKTSGMFDQMTAQSTPEYAEVGKRKFFNNSSKRV